MRRRYSGFVLWVCAFVFVVTGVAFTFAPESMFEEVGLDLVGGSSMTELRAVYGGVHLAIGVFLVVCARRDLVGRELGLLLSFLSFSGLAGYRAVGMLVDGPQLAFMTTLLVMESAGVLFALSGLVSLRGTNLPASS